MLLPSRGDRQEDRHRFYCSILPDKLKSPDAYQNLSMSIILDRGELGTKHQYSDSFELEIEDSIKQLPKQDVINRIKDTAARVESYVTEKGLRYDRSHELLKWAGPR